MDRLNVENSEDESWLLLDTDDIGTIRWFNIFNETRYMNFSAITDPEELAKY